MRRLALLSSFLIAIAGALLVPATSANAAKVPVYRNCTAMHAKYKGGVAKRGAHDKRKSGHARFRPVVNDALYNANRKMDADHDGIACEQ